MKRAHKYIVLSLLLLATAGFSISASGESAVKNYRVKVIAEYKHDTKAYTQGLFFFNNQMYESCGEYGESSFRKVDFNTGKVLSRINYPRQFFIEGSTVLGKKLFILTWREETCFVYDIETMKSVGTFYNPREGWGLTTDGEKLITSDGSSNLYFVDPKNFATLSQLKVTLNGKPVEQLNELEYINGEVWANVYQTDNIMIINPKTGVVRAVVNCKNLLPQSLRTPDTDVLNGIAYNPVTKSIYLTGKNWARLFKIQLVP